VCQILNIVVCQINLVAAALNLGGVAAATPLSLSLGRARKKESLIHINDFVRLI
jgi:hypothetical protein